MKANKIIKIKNYNIYLLILAVAIILLLPEKQKLSYMLIPNSFKNRNKDHF